MPDIQTQKTTLPFSLFVNQAKGSPLSSGAISFTESGDWSIQYHEFTFQNGSLQRGNFSQIAQSPTLDLVVAKPIPVFSILAIVLLILFRNLFHNTFQRYFLSPVNNYEIDFNFQKIGIFPIILSLLITILAFSEIKGGPSQEWSSIPFLLKELGFAFQVLLYPLVVSVLLLVLLNFSARFFPILFSDIKSLFGVSLLVIVWNFVAFGSPVLQNIPSVFFWGGIGILYLIFRSFLFFHVLRNAYRFRMPITLFYICILNLGTFLLLYRSISTEILKLL